MYIWWVYVGLLIINCVYWCYVSAVAHEKQWCIEHGCFMNGSLGLAAKARIEWKPDEQSYSCNGMCGSGLWEVYLVARVKGQIAIVFCRFPLYYELKVAFVIWLLSPYTRGASLIFRKFLHPLLASRERVRPPVPSQGPQLYPSAVNQYSPLKRRGL